MVGLIKKVINEILIIVRKYKDTNYTFDYFSIISVLKEIIHHICMIISKEKVNFKVYNICIHFLNTIFNKSFT